MGIVRNIAVVDALHHVVAVVKAIVRVDAKVDVVEAVEVCVGSSVVLDVPIIFGNSSNHESDHNLMVTLS